MAYINVANYHNYKSEIAFELHRCIARKRPLHAPFESSSLASSSVDNCNKSYCNAIMQGMRNEGDRRNAGKEMNLKLARVKGQNGGSAQKWPCLRQEKEFPSKHISASVPK